MTPEGISQY